MIPKTLTFKGLYSYQEKQHIDFIHLLEGQLFGIFGSVGSGKSSILEAITYALYGETDRLNNRDNRNYNMMNLKSDELWIDYTFLNHEQNEYRFTVQAKRNSKDFDNVRTYQRSAYKKVDGEWAPVEVSLTPEITGLTYQNFRRTVIIPQGKFQEFLQLTDKERTNMMKELFNLDKYEFFGQTAALENRNKEKLSNLRGRLSHFEQVNQEVISEKTKAAKEAEEQVQELIELRKKAEASVQSFEKLRELFEDLSIKKKVYNQLLQQKDAFKQRKQDLEKYEGAQQEFGNLIARRKEIQEDITVYQQQQTKIGELLKSKKEEKERLEEAFSKAEQEYKNIEQKKQALADLKEWEQVLDSDETVSKLLKRIADGERKIENVKEDATHLEKKREELEAKILKLKEEMPDQQILIQLRDWFNHKKSLAEKLEERKQELEDIGRKERNNKTKLWKELPEGIAKGLPEEVRENAYKLDGWLNNHLEHLIKRRNQVAHKLDHFKLQSKLEAYADDLKEGEPCPLCGSETHPSVLNAGDVSEQIAELQKDHENLENQIKQHQNAISHCNLIHSLNKDLDDQKANITKKLQQLERQYNEHLKSFNWKDYSAKNEKQVSDLTDKMQIIANQLKKSEQEYKATEKLLKETNGKADEYERLLTDIRNQKIAAETTRKGAKERLRLLRPDQMPSTKELLEKEISHKEKLVEDTEQHYKKLEKLRQSLKEELLQLQTKQSQMQEHLETLGKRQAHLNEEVQNKLSKLGYSQVAEVEKILNQDIDVRQERSQIERFEQDFFAADKNLQEARLKTEGRIFENEVYEQEKQRLSQLLEKEEILKNKKITLDHELKQLHQSLKEKKQIESELDQLEKRADNLRTMRQLFKGSGFVNYVSSVYLQNLCDAANERFYKLTRQQLQLEIDGNNNFRVRDFLNDGRTRSVKTLSGGQTFQASLSLALALAGSVQQQSLSNQNFFFLDEGFGTLDRESLQTVFDTLKSLRNENRFVGVISHVEEMQQEIDMFIKVTKDPEKGSMVKGSWE